MRKREQVDSPMEEDLQDLLKAGTRESRIGRAVEHKRKGGRIAGILDSRYIPEEIVSASGFLPWRVFGTTSANLRHLEEYGDPSGCAYCQRVLESVLDGNFDFVDVFIGSDWDDGRRRLVDTIGSLGKHTITVSVPRIKTPTAVLQFSEEIKRLARVLGETAGLPESTSEAAVERAVTVHNETRELMRALYETRKKKIPPLSGAEFLSIVQAARTMSPEYFNGWGKRLLPYLSQRETRLSGVEPRVLVAGDSLDDVALIQMVESSALVAMDDTDVGSRYFYLHCSQEPGSVFIRIARAYLGSFNCPHLLDWDDQANELLSWVEEFGIDGVIEFTPDNATFRRWRCMPLAKRLGASKVPYLSIQYDYGEGGLSQVEQRVEAFLEILRGI